MLKPQLKVSNSLLVELKKSRQCYFVVDNDAFEMMLKKTSENRRHFYVGCSISKSTNLDACFSSTSARLFHSLFNSQSIYPNIYIYILGRSAVLVQVNR